MVRLLADTIAIQGISNQKRFLLEGLCQLVKGDFWAWTLAYGIRAGGHQNYASYHYGGFDEARFARFLHAIEHPEMGRVAAPFFKAIEERGEHVTMPRHEIDPTGIAYESEAGERWDKAGIGCLMMSYCPLGPDAMSSIGIYRSLNAPCFTPREVRMVHLILKEVTWLHDPECEDDISRIIPRLTPRHRQILNLLLDGIDTRSISSHLRLSPNTVRGYVKKVYRTFQVHSQAELLSKFR